GSGPSSSLVEIPSEVGVAGRRLIGMIRQAADVCGVHAAMVLAVEDPSGARARRGVGMAGKRHGLIARRLALGLTQESLAARLGVTPLTVRRWETGEVKGGPRPYARHQLARHLKVSSEELEELLAEGVGAESTREAKDHVAPTAALDLDDEERLVLAAKAPGCHDPGVVDVLS